MAGAMRENLNQPINWVEKYIERLSRDMEELRGMEGRLTAKIEANNAKIDNINQQLTERIDANNKQTQNLVLAMIIGIGAMTVAMTIAIVVAAK